jgi:hypothetical protein
MPPSGARSTLVDWSAGIDYFLGRLSELLLSPGSVFSLTSLLCALCIAVAFIAVRRHRRNRRIRIRTITRALFPKRILCASTYTDVGYMYYNLFVHGLAFGWALVSYEYLTNGLIAGLVVVFGPVTPRASFGGGAHAADQFPRASGRFDHLRQHPRRDRGGR